MKLTIPRLFDATRMLATQAGKDVSELIDFLQQFAEQSIRAFRNGITFEDNVRCAIPTVTLKHGVEQVVNVTGSVTGVIPVRVFNTKDGGPEAMSAFFWSFNNAGQLVVKANFVSATNTRNIDVKVIVLLS